MIITIVGLDVLYNHDRSSLVCMITLHYYEAMKKVCAWPNYYLDLLMFL